MPELPEVETIRRQLAKTLQGAEFVSVRELEYSMLRDCRPEQLKSWLPGAKVSSTERVGKFILLELKPGGSSSFVFYLTIHLGMTGQLLINPRDPGKHVRFVFEMRGREGEPICLQFRDMRKFGRLHLTVGTPAPRLALLGPDAWVGEWDAGYLARELCGRRASLKAFLLDQRHLSGIGNIYSDEILWWSRLCPLRSCGSLSSDEIVRLAQEIRRILGEGVRLLGCSISDFVDTQGSSGEFQKWLRVYGRQGKKCFRCGARLVRAVVSGRGTIYCPECQPKNASPE